MRRSEIPRFVEFAVSPVDSTFAKWPPDDDVPGEAPTGGGAGFAGGAYGDDGDFKKGRTKPAFIAVLGLTIIGGAALGAYALTKSATTVDVKQAAAEKKGLYLLPKAEQIPKWRIWAAQTEEKHLRQEAFAQLAWSKDAEGLPLIIKGLEDKDQAVRGRAAQALLEYTKVPGAADKARPALLKAFAIAEKGDKAQIAWSLAAFKESSAFDKVFDEYREGNLQNVQRLDESKAFDPDVIVQMTTLEKLAALIDDPAEAKKKNPESVKQLIATALANTGDAKWLPQLTKLVEDKSIEVAREAAVGLGKIANEASITPLLNALDRADRDSRTSFLRALEEGVGAEGLVLALRSVGHGIAKKDEANRAMIEKGQTKQIFDLLKELEDPRGADALARYLATDIKPHWKTEAAIRLAEIGDARGAATLGWRLKQSPLKLYNKAEDPELMRDDMERVVAARMLADLALLYPEKRGELLAAAEDGALNWSTSLPQPHANAMRFLAAAGSKAAIPKLHAWADPSKPLPKEGQQEMDPVWATSQSALRYLGVAKDPGAFALLEKQLKRRPEKLDVTKDAMNQGGLAVLGMTLRGLAVGATDGFAEYGDPKAYPLLVKFIETPQNHEESRGNACFALASVATDEQMKEIAKKVMVDFAKPDPATQVIRACYLETLVRHPVSAVNEALFDLMKPDQPGEIRTQAARAIGLGGLSPEMTAKLLPLLKDQNTANSAALALLIGGDKDAAARAVAAYEDIGAEYREVLKEDYARTFGYWSDRNYEHGDMARWIANAEECARVRVRDGLQDWVKMTLSRALIEGAETDNGPHSWTRVRLRARLYKDAKSGDATKAGPAIRMLKFLKEKGVLMALRHEPGEIGELAKIAFFEVMNPKQVADRLPDAPKKK